MKANVKYPSAQHLNARLSYDPQNGKLFWKERPKSDFKDEHAWKIFMVRFAGKEAGHKCFEKNGRAKCVQVRLKIDGKATLFAGHRLAYALMGVQIPDGFEVDHKDTNPFNNRWANLRLATRVQNAANQKVRLNRKHKHLPKGVSKKRTRFRAQIGYGGKQIGLGTHATAEAAHAAYAKKAQELYGDFARFN